MTISTLTPEHINRYTSRFNILSNLELDKLRQNAAARSDILPCIQQDTACLLQLIVQLIRASQSIRAWHRYWSVNADYCRSG